MLVSSLEEAARGIIRLLLLLLLLLLPLHLRGVLNCEVKPPADRNCSGEERGCVNVGRQAPRGCQRRPHLDLKGCSAWRVRSLLPFHRSVG